jgi:hypothetical protein
LGNLNKFTIFIYITSVYFMTIMVSARSYSAFWRKVGSQNLKSVPIKAPPPEKSGAIRGSQYFYPPNFPEPQNMDVGLQQTLNLRISNKN